MNTTFLHYVKTNVNFTGNREAKELKDNVDICAYSGKLLLPKKRSLEHVKARSKGGASDISNYIITGIKINSHREDEPLSLVLKKNPDYVKNIQSYLDKVRGLIINGRDYVKTVIPTLNREAKGVAVFKGRIHKSQ